MNGKKPLILICDDDRNLCEIIETSLQYDGYRTDITHTGKGALERLKQGAHDLIILDLKLPDISGIQTLKAIQKLDKKPLAVMISGEGDIHTAVEATQCGAFDFLEKPLDADRIMVTIRNALDKSRLEKEKAHLLQSMADQYRMVGKSDKINKIHFLIGKAANTNSKVLIEGENGTGKELVARAIHHQSTRVSGPFIAVNCAAIPENLIESELFGHKKGSFTGAIADKPGRFQDADNGTIFLDEIGDMSLMTQAKVLRVLEEGVMEMVGGRQPIHVDVRVIAATNKDLQHEMDVSNFREDLFFRLNVLNIKMPPLRERKEDIPVLTDHFVQMFCHEHSIHIKQIMPDAIECLMTYNWPGNIRELKNIIEKMVILIETREIRSKDVNEVLQVHSRKHQDILAMASLREARESFERQFIRNKLAVSGWNITKTAEHLDMPRTYLHKKIKMLGIMYGE